MFCTNHDQNIRSSLIWRMLYVVFGPWLESLSIDPASQRILILTFIEKTMLTGHKLINKRQKHDILWHHRQIIVYFSKFRPCAFRTFQSQMLLFDRHIFLGIFTPCQDKRMYAICNTRDERYNEIIYLSAWSEASGICIAMKPTHCRCWHFFYNQIHQPIKNIRH